MTQATPQFPPTRQANFTLAILVIAYVFSLLDRQILSLMVAPIRQDLGITDVQISLLQGMAFALFFSLMAVPIGRLADWQNRKIIIAVGIFLWSLMTVASGLASTFAVLFIARMGVGVGEAALAPSANSLLSDSFPPSKLARATAIFSLGTSIGSGTANIIGGTALGLLAGAQSFDLPLLGTLRPWQLAFVIAGLPGFIVSAIVLLIREPLRQGLAKQADGTVSTRASFAEVAKFMYARKGTYGAIFVAISLLSMLGYGYLNWYPTFIIRTYGVPAHEVGLIFGILYLVFGSIGAYGSGWFAEFLTRRGFTDAPLRAVMFVAIAFVPFAIGPLMPTAVLAFALGAPTFMLINAYFGVAFASLQLITPNQMRAVVIALFMLVVTLIGSGLGATLIASLTQYVFRDELALRYSLMLVTVVVAPLASLACGLGLRPFRAALQAAQAWGPEANTHH